MHDAITPLTVQVEALSTKLNQLTKAQLNAVTAELPLAESKNHITEHEQVNFVNNRQNNSFSNTDNPRWRNQPNFSWKDNKSSSQPPGFGKKQPPQNYQSRPQDQL
jgi:hypothetical protein